MLTFYITKTHTTVVASIRAGKRHRLSMPVESFDPTSLVSPLLSFVKENNWKGSAAILAISMDQLLFHQAQCDERGPDWRMYQTIHANFGLYFPGVAVDGCFMDFEVLTVQQQGEQTHLLQIYAVSKVFIGTYMAVLEHVGLQVQAVHPFSEKDACGGMARYGD